MVRLPKKSEVVTTLLIAIEQKSIVKWKILLDADANDNDLPRMEFISFPSVQLKYQAGLVQMVSSTKDAADGND